VEGLDARAVDSSEARYGIAKVIRYSPNEIEIETDSTSPAYLVSSEAYYHGWEAAVDGHAENIQRTNVAFRGLPVPAGRHRIQFHFFPTILVFSAAISLVTLAALVAYAGFTRRTEA
jgi:uncharacterized membrane protein YfhO